VKGERWRAFNERERERARCQVRRSLEVRAVRDRKGARATSHTNVDLVSSDLY